MPETEFILRGEYIELFKLLKAAGLCGSGAEAKHAITENRVRVNGEPETRKAFKVRAGHRVEFEGETLVVSAS